ncbi:WXG100 family type VII secretion target [Georgenia faecalis]|uniref:ESAT-6-like protein n=1 Tax=Georgenia faecalis TaxID=2483799 RepID=A0ABV9D4Y2_9MICO|nr:WXG100 family type VII secretion target [Georgenia faecalis]
MSRYQVDSAEVAHSAALARQSAALIHAEVASMMAQLTTLQGTWSGAAASSFAAVAEDWRHTQQLVEASLAQITEALDAAAQTYADAESSAHGLFAR